MTDDYMHIYENFAQYCSQNRWQPMEFADYVKSEFPDVDATQLSETEAEAIYCEMFDDCQECGATIDKCELDEYGACDQCANDIDEDE